MTPTAGSRSMAIFSAAMLVTSCRFRREVIDSGVADVVVEQSEGLVDADPVDGFRFRPSAGSATATTVESIPATPEPKIIAGTSRGSCAGR
jgi:hypothetical protein